MTLSLEALVALFLNLALALAGSDFGWLWLSPSACGSLCLPLALSYLYLPLALAGFADLLLLFLELRGLAELTSLSYVCCCSNFAASLASFVE